MEIEHKFIVEQFLIHYDPEELKRWRKGDKLLVPERYLKFKGPGLSNGYGYGEFVAGRYLKDLGNEVIINDYGLIGTKSKYAYNNNRIESALGKEKFERLRKAIKILLEQSIRIEQPDLCVISPEIFFAEVKRDKDSLRKPQRRFAALVSVIFHIPFKVYKILPAGTEFHASPIEIIEAIPDECFL